MTRQFNHPRRGDKPLSSCDEAREAISARHDDELRGRHVKALDTHIARCRDCRQFESDVASLQRHLIFRQSLIPASLNLSQVAPARKLRPLDSDGVLRRAGAVLLSNREGVVRWSLALVPVALLAVILPLGPVWTAAHPTPARHAVLCFPRDVHW